MKESGQVYFYHNDHLGTPQKLTNISGAVVWSATYDAFGKASVDASSTVVNNLRFPGQYHDAETGLHYNWHRFYDPIAGRYNKVDPIGFDGGDVNLYAYVRNRPVRWVDVYGLWPYHGNWCGPDWTGRYEKSYDELTPEEKAKADDPSPGNPRGPKTPLDSCCKYHDKCYGNARDACKCSPDPTSCLRKKQNDCDEQFNSCTDKLPAGLKAIAAQFVVGNLQPHMRNAEAVREEEMEKNRDRPVAVTGCPGGCPTAMPQISIPF